MIPQAQEEMKRRDKCLGGVVPNSGEERRSFQYLKTVTGTIFWMQVEMEDNSGSGLDSSSWTGRDEERSST